MRILLTTLLLLLPIMASAGSSFGLSAALEQLGVATRPDDLPVAPVPGFLEISKGAKLLYISRDGQLLIDGDVISMASATNLTERRRAALRLEQVQRVPENERIIFRSAGSARERLIVFTDTNCRYCLRFHRQLDEYSRRGIDVQYLFYPRSGPTGESFEQAVAVWCAADRKRALASALAGKRVPAAKCNNPVMRHFDLATELRLKGTPAIIAADGTIHYGAADVENVLGQSKRSP